jgi:hypothetical protein
MDQSSGQRIVDPAPPGPPPANGNGTTAHAAAGQHPEAAAAGPNGTTDPMDRAEQIVDHLAERVADVTSRLGRGMLWLSTRLKEQAEDVWAEAQSIRRGDQK